MRIAGIKTCMYTRVGTALVLAAMLTIVLVDNRYLLSLGRSCTLQCQSLTALDKMDCIVSNANQATAMSMAGVVVSFGLFLLLSRRDLRRARILLAGIVLALLGTALVFAMRLIVVVAATA